MIASMSKPIDGKGSWSYPQGTYNGRDDKIQFSL